MSKEVVRGAHPKINIYVVLCVWTRQRRKYSPQILLKRESLNITERGQQIKIVFIITLIADLNRSILATSQSFSFLLLRYRELQIYL
jgi:hypothetical protein